LSDENKKGIRFLCISCYSTIDAEPKLIGSKQSCPHCRQPVNVPKVSLFCDEVLCGYKINKFLGAGGMGEVYQALHIEDDKEVALKVIRPQVVNEEEIENFKKEIRMNLRVSHSNFVRGYEAGTDEHGRHFLAMEFIRGRSLEDHIIKRGRFDEDHALSIILTVAKALCSAFNNWQIIHRDIKPSNILISKANVIKIMDLGISTPVSENNDDLHVIGTPYYMSPEQIRTPASIDQRADIYSLGATLYELLTGMEPFNGKNSDEIFNKVLNETPMNPKTLRPKLSDATCNLIKKFMHKDKNRRPNNWEEAISDIEAAVNRYQDENSYELETKNPKLIYTMKKDMKNYAPLMLAGLGLFTLFIAFAYWLVTNFIP